jgi:CheY-like chemotaxis protein
MAILNLAVNARDAMPDGGRLTIAAALDRIAPGHRSNLPEGVCVRLSVSDTGVGMDAATLKRAVEPFFSTKGIGKGTGLGLSMVDGLLAQLGGAVTIQSRSGVGTCVELWLPITEGAEETPEQTAEPASVAAGTALLVDDEAVVRASTAEMLMELGYRVIEASSAEKALDMIAGGVKPDLVVTDHLMPGMTGADLARQLKRQQPGLPVLIISGYAENAGLDADLPLLVKPFRQADLAAFLAKLP